MKNLTFYLAVASVLLSFPACSSDSETGKEENRPGVDDLVVSINDVAVEGGEILFLPSLHLRTMKFHISQASSRMGWTMRP